MTEVPILPAPVASPVAAEHQKQAGTKRKRNDSQDPSGPELQRKVSRDGPKKKKANRACFHCQKAHLTCDDCMLCSSTLIPGITRPPARPCQRCIKRGIANSCTEGHRKKAKYLLDEEELGGSQLIHCCVYLNVIQ